MREGDSYRAPPGASLVRRARRVSGREPAGGAALAAAVRRQGAASAGLYQTGALLLLI